MSLELTKVGVLELITPPPVTVEAIIPGGSTLVIASAAVGSLRTLLEGLGVDTSQPYEVTSIIGYDGSYLITVDATAMYPWWLPPSVGDAQGASEAVAPGEGIS